ncbi:MAG: hypothetical protein HQ582_11410 [Planctomycetes bacterium]|nr:hypothetical protein [Planctomycetota bacterium]
MNSPKPNLPTATILGKELPIIADLGAGWFLAAHPNGPAIGRDTYVNALWSDSTETITAGEDATDDNSIPSPIPEVIRAAAVKAFKQFAWPLVRGKFYLNALVQQEDGMAKPETTACWYNLHGPRAIEWTPGLFHQWGTEMGAAEGDGNYSIAIVEDARSHAVVTVLPDNIHFGTAPTGDTP